MPKRRPCCSDGTVLRARLDLGGIDLGQERRRARRRLRRGFRPRARRSANGRRSRACSRACRLAPRRTRSSRSRWRGRAAACANAPRRSCSVKADGTVRNDAPALGQRAIQRGKAHVVADRQPDPAPRQVGDHGGFARLVIGGLAIALAAGQIDVEHVDLVVAGEHVAVGPDQERAVDGALRRSKRSASEPICRWIFSSFASAR